MQTLAKFCGKTQSGSEVLKNNMEKNWKWEEEKKVWNRGKNGRKWWISKVLYIWGVKEDGKGMKF